MTDYLKKYHICEALDHLNKRYPNGRWPENDPDYACIRLFQSAVALSDQRRKMIEDPRDIIQRHIDEGDSLPQIALELGISVSKLRTLIKRYRTLADRYNYYRERV